ncbi:hypothetical protein O181_037795 [Austropuccinia psidii MF-1]|uniref:Integrase zinc-binding domain-containing protein n=1 Tax=Austropuccinia psidii MF-1 TaxID=1389203 RepID=A0A9Q3DBP9_9BASI|nr:hypothetical protein [Austropuccinia psidii MF-1]
MALIDRALINTIIQEWIDSIVSGHFSEDRTLERVKTHSGWPNWRNDVAESFKTCDRFQKANRATGKKFGMMIQIQEPKFPCKIAHVDWVTALQTAEDRILNVFLVLVDRYIKYPMFFPFHKDETDMDTAIMIWNGAIIHKDLLQNIICDRDPKFT